MTVGKFKWFSWMNTLFHFKQKVKGMEYFKTKNAKKIYYQQPAYCNKMKRGEEKKIIFCQILLEYISWEVFIDLEIYN